MLQICRSNAVEALATRLAFRLEDAPLASPFTAELVVIPSPAMARWLNLQLAQHHGVAANYDYRLPASFVWHLAQTLLDELPDRDPLEQELAAWRIYALLPDMLTESGFEPLRHYLRPADDALKRWQLAHRIADVFDRYQLYRPNLIRDWEAGKGGSDWQAGLWCRLTEGLPVHRVPAIDRLLQHLGSNAPPEGIPERVSIFAVSSLPPLFVEVLHALAALIPVDLYLHSPTDQFWSDLVSQKALARKRLAKPDEADLWEVGNPLLASWGRQGQALHDLLLERELEMVEEDVYVETSAKTLLGRLHGDIFALSAGDSEGPAYIGTDDSLQVHICHSALRECQVLHDDLLRMLADDPDLRPEDILVMIPEISSYAPYIEAVFDQDEGRSRPFIPWNLSDISTRDEHPLVQVFLQLLDLPNSRFGQSEILSLLDVPELTARFGLDGDALTLIRDWLSRANLRWGLDASHKGRLGLPEIPDNTWAQAEERLFAGYALSGEQPFDGMAPLAGVEGANAETLGRFWRLLSRLQTYAESLARPRSATDWETCIDAMLSDLFGEAGDEGGRIQKIRDTVAELAEQAGAIKEPLPPALLRHWLEQRLSAEGRRGRYFRGGITICGMRPMRSLPFRVICLLGMHDQAFPRRDRPTELDRIPETWRPGDPRIGEEDRYLFLETLLCARRILYISYVGRDIRRNTERQPSVLVRELLDYLDQHYRINAKETRPSRHLMRVHPMQPFSPRNFRGAAPGFDDYWWEAAQAQLKTRTPGPNASLSWPDRCLDQAATPPNEVRLEQLVRFLRHPVKGLVNGRLKIWLEEEEIEEDEEIFSLDRLQGFLLEQRLLSDTLMGSAPGIGALRAEGLLPHGAFADLAYDQELQRVGPLVDTLQPYRDREPELIALDLTLNGEQGPYRLTGQVSGIYPELGLLRYRPARIRGGDVLELWLAHLAWCAAGGPGEKCSLLYGIDETFSLDVVLPPHDARSALAHYLDLYRDGLQRPLLVLPKASWAYAARVRAGGRGDPMNTARSQWQGNGYNGVPGDRDDPYLRLVLLGFQGNPLEHPDFTRLASALYEQVLDLGETINC